MATGSNIIDLGSESEPEEQENDESDSVLEVGSLKEQLDDCLSSIKTGGTFASSHSQSAFVNPGLFIEGIGKIGLPLAERDAEKIIESCQLAALRNGSAKTSNGRGTILYRRGELDPGQFYLRNPAWEAYVRVIVKEVVDELGITGGSLGIRAELTKLQIHVDENNIRSEFVEVVGNIGSLTICLPSTHVGGQVRISHDGQTKSFHTAGTSDYCQSYVARYSDVTCEVEPVTSGYQLLLVYNLVQPNTSALAPASRFLRENPNILVYMLDNLYKDELLKASALLGLDRVRVNVLSKACAAEGFCLYLASLQHSKSGPTEEPEYYRYDRYGQDYDLDDGEHHTLSDVDEEAISLERVVELEGREITRTFHIDLEDVVQDDFNIEDREPDEEDYGGDYGGNTTHYWRYTAIVLIPSEHRIGFLYDAVKTTSDGITDWLRRLQKDIQKDPSNLDLQEELLRLSELIIDHMPTRSNELGTAVDVAISHKRADLVERVLRDPRLPITTLNMIGGALHKIEIASIERGMSKAISNLNTFYGAYTALNRIVSSYKEGLRPDSSPSVLAALAAWRRGEIETMMTSNKMLGADDGWNLIEIAIEYGNDLLFRKILPLTKNNISDKAFVMQFVHGLIEAGQERKLDKAVVENVFRDLLEDLIATFTLKDDKPSNKRQKVDNSTSSRPSYPQTTHSSSVRTAQPAKVVALRGTDMAYLFGYCDDFGWHIEKETILDRFKREADALDPSQSGTTIIRFLEQLLDVLIQRNIPLSSQRYQRCFQSLTSLYIRGHVGMEPARPRISNSIRPCDRQRDICVVCKDFEKFLADTTRASYKFTGKESLRNHLQKRLPSYGYKIDTLRRGSPYTLVVTKLEVEWMNEHNQWKKRCNKTAGEIRDMGFEQILGPKFYDVMAMKDVQLRSIENEVDMLQ
ncbi:MAG: hypothetical protein M1812_005946 [Candelaria pacifica]|nr:MAG: hypothetical protein M1812_005946 [Candelaria pacifica]